VTNYVNQHSGLPERTEKEVTKYAKTIQDGTVCDAARLAPPHAPC
jgi:hypothetical protein